MSLISFRGLSELGLHPGLFCQSAIEMAQSDHQDLIATMLQDGCICGPPCAVVGFRMFELFELPPCL
eukprot:4113580-Amphidinium_carterae.1